MTAFQGKSRRKFLSVAALAPVVALLGTTGCGESTEDTQSGDGDGDGAPTFTAPSPIPEADLVDMTGKSTVEISVVDNTFEPKFVKVSPGTRVIWTNDGRNKHNVIPAQEGSFAGVATDDFEPGASHAATFEAVGDYAYFCSIHGTAKAGQNGVVSVVS